MNNAGLSDNTQPLGGSTSPNGGFGQGETTLIGQTFSNGTYHFSGNQDIDATLIGSKWTLNHLTYSFPTSGQSYGSSYLDGRNNQLDAFNAQQQAGMIYAMGLIASYTNLTFSPTTESSTNHAQLRFAQTRDSSAVGSAEGEFPASHNEAGDVWFGETGQPFYTTPAKGNWGQATEMHELGHALGLKHGHQDYTTLNLYADGDIDSPGGNTPRYGSAALPANHDGQDWSLMTYQSDPANNTQFEGDGFNQPQTYMQDDIAALQYLYGANFNTASGDTTYTWSPTTGEEFINGVGQGAPTGDKISMTLWDGNGNDTYDLSNYTTNLSIDLRPGAFSTFSTAQLVNHQAYSGGFALAAGNVANALLYNNDPRSLIENAMGGSGDDTIVGNTANNTLTGGAGADTLTGGGGHDTFKDSGAGLNSDAITDFSASDEIWITNAAFGSFTFNYDATSDAVTFSGGSLASSTIYFSSGLTGDLGKTSDASGGVDLALYDAPVLTGINSAVAGVGQTPMILNGAAAITDQSLDEQSGGAGDYAGAEVTLARDGGASAQDIFGFATDGAAFSADAGVLSVAGQAFGTYVLSGGLLTIDFTSAVATATSALVDDVLGAVTYENTAGAPPASVRLDYAYAGPSGPDFVADGQTTVTIAHTNAAPTATVPQASYGVIVGQTLALKGTGLAIADADDGGGTETATLTVTEGTLSAAAGDSGAIVTGSGTGTVTIQGSVGQIDALLGSGGTGTLNFSDATGNPAVGLTLGIDDNGHTGGPPLGASASGHIVVTAPPPPPPPPVVAFDPTVTFRGPLSATLTGTASDASGITGVEIFEGTKDLGAATLDPGTGAWSFHFNDGRGFKTGLSAVASAGDGRTSSAASHYDLTTGIGGEPFTAIQDNYDANDQFIGQSLFDAKGALYLQTSITTNPDGSFSQLSSNGTSFDSLPYYAFNDSFNAAGRAIEEDVYYNDGHQTVQGLVGHQPLASIADDTFLPTGKRNTFVFTPGFGADTITAFNLAGPGHDTISLPDGFSTHLGALLAHATTDAGGDAVIHIGSHESITVQGVSVAELRHHKNDFTFHA